MTQRQLATAAKMSLGAIRDLEQGRTAWPRWTSVEALTAALELDPGYRRGLRPLPAGGEHIGAATVISQSRGIEIGILGPIVATRSGRAVDLGPGRQRAVLAMLALNPNHAVRMSELIDALWPARPPKSAAIIVQGYVSRLRRAFEPELAPRSRGRFVGWTGDGYRLQTSRECHVDIEMFRRLQRAGDVAARAGDLAGARQEYDDAICLCRGRTAADLRFLREHPAVTDAEAARSDTILRYCDLAVLPEGQRKALRYLRALCAAQEFNEPAFARLITLMGSTGQGAAATLLFENFRFRLQQELGIRPSGQVTEAYLQVVANDAAELTP